MPSASRGSGLEIPISEVAPVTAELAREVEITTPGMPSSSSGSAVLPLEPGALIAERYRVLRKIGEGGMGVLYACLDTVLARDVAVKLMQRSLAADRQLSERLLREARLAAQLHQHVAQVYDCGSLATGEPYIVMELLKGRDLYALLRESGPMSPGYLSWAMRDVCVGLAEAHAKGIIHRDLKPENLFCARDPDGSAVIKIVDFGVSKQLANAQLRAMTSPTESVGSPQYMSPEQITKPAEVDGRTDIWSLGVVMFELLTGVLPFTGSGSARICASVLSNPVPPLSNYRQDVPLSFEALIRRCLEKDRDTRFQSAAELGAALAALGLREPVPSSGIYSLNRTATEGGSRRWLWAIGAGIFAACALAGTLAMLGGHPHVPTRADVSQLAGHVSAAFGKPRLQR